MGNFVPYFDSLVFNASLQSSSVVLWDVKIFSAFPDISSSLLGYVARLNKVIR